MGRPLWRRTARRQACNADRDYRWLGAALFCTWDKRANRRPAVPDQSRHPVLSRLRGAAPVCIYRVDRLDGAAFAATAERLRGRMRTLATTTAVPYRQQNAGDYLIPSMQLKPGLEPPGVTGFGLHLKRTDATDDRSLPDLLAPDSSAHEPLARPAAASERSRTS